MDFYTRIEQGYYSDVEYPETADYPDKELRNKARQVYRTKMNELRKEFKRDLLYEFGLEDFVNKDLVFEYAWDAAHANGFQEIFNYMVDFSELFFVDRRLLK